MIQVGMTRKRRVAASRKTANLGPRALEHQKQYLASAPVWSAGLGTVLVCPLAGAAGAGLVPVLLYFLVGTA